MCVLNFVNWKERVQGDHIAQFQEKALVTKGEFMGTSMEEEKFM